MTETITLDKNTFLRSFKVLANQSYDLFLGAGASVSSGIPSGTDLVWQFKREIFCLERDIHPSKFRDLQIESNRKIIQSFFDERGDNDIDNPYSHFFEECYPDPLVRKEFLTNLVRDKKPSIGFLCLAALVESKKLNVVWTTNFDDLIEKAINSLNFSSCSIISPENASSVSSYKDDIPKVVKLHGDFRYDPLQSTDDELQKLEKNLQEYIIKSSEDRGLIIVAYSGSDQSIMETLQKAIQNPSAFPKGLIWCIPKGIKPREVLIQLINKANEQNGRSGFIEIDSFDFFLHELYKICDLQNEHIDSISKELFKVRKAFQISQTASQTTPILLNGIKARSFPKTIYSTTTDLEGWSELRKLLQEKRIVGALYKGQTLLWGNEDDINNTVKGRIKDELKVIDIPEKLFFYSDSIYLGLLYDLVEKAFVEDYSLKIFARGKSIKKIFSKEHPLSDDEISNIKKWNRNFFVPSDIRIYEAFEFKIELIKKSLFLLICPTIHIEKQDGMEPERRQNQYLSNIILSNRYNNLYSGKLFLWLKILKEINAELTFKLDAFEIKLGTYYSTAANQQIENIFNFDSSLRLEEPFIYFHHKDESQKNINPINGLRIFGPIEESYGKLNGLQKVNLAVLSPDFGFENVRSHLENLKTTISPKSEKEYLKEYPGFEEIYKKHLIIPNNSDSEFVNIIPNREVQKFGAVQFYDYLKTRIDRISIKQNEIDCLIVYIPDSWKKFRELKSEETYFDLHDSLKLYCLKKGLKVQFIEDKSIKYFDQAKIRWWLSLGIYVKSNATPWKVKTDDLETAFVGLGYAVRRNARQKVVLGSSQIFDSNGNGLKILVQPIEKPIFYNRNPFMSKEDAFKLVSNIRNTYHRIDPNIGLRKIVIHKTTHFTRDEIEGISNALKGVDNIELLQIQQFSYWRAIKLFKDFSINRHKPDDYPIERGTIIQLDDYTFLLWTHGLVENPELDRKYYQGKRGVPTPLMIKRFRGTDPIETVAKDIMKLTKMNWNGAELYKTLPVTIYFSKRLSKMGKQTEELSNKAYDFRYFI